jgi:hypothetical protein
VLLRRHADASVGDDELDEGAAIAYLACRKLDLPCFGELAGIAEGLNSMPPPDEVLRRAPIAFVSIPDDHPSACGNTPGRERGAEARAVLRPLCVYVSGSSLRIILIAAEGELQSRRSLVSQFPVRSHDF